MSLRQCCGGSGDCQTACHDVVNETSDSVRHRLDLYDSGRGHKKTGSLCARRGARVALKAGRGRAAHRIIQRENGGGKKTDSRFGPGKSGCDLGGRAADRQDHGIFCNGRGCSERSRCALRPAVRETERKILPTRTRDSVAAREFSLTLTGGKGYI